MADNTALGYADRLAALSETEEEEASRLAAEAQAAMEAQMQEQIARGKGDAAGLGAVGGGAGNLRSASYAQGNVGQQGATETARLTSLQEQAARQRMMDVYGRRGQYTLSGQEAEVTEAGQADIDARKKAAAEEAAENLRDAQTAGAVGTVTGALGSFLGSDPKMKRNIKSAKEGDEDELASVLARLDMIENPQWNVDVQDLAANYAWMREHGETRKDWDELVGATPRRRQDAVRGSYIEPTTLSAEEEDEEFGLATEEFIRRGEQGEPSGPGAYTYSYRPGAGGPGVSAPPGEHYGPMAQELEKTRLGRGMVVDTPSGKAVDPGAASLGALGLASSTRRAVDDLENRLKSAGVLTKRKRGVESEVK